MSDDPHAATHAAPAAATPAPARAHDHPAPSRSKGNKRALGFAILVVAIIYFLMKFLGADNLKAAGDNLGKRLINSTDPDNPWGPWDLPALNLDLVFMILVIFIAVCFIFNPWSTKVIVVEKKAETTKGHDHGHH